MKSAVIRRPFEYPWRNGFRKSLVPPVLHRATRIIQNDGWPSLVRQGLRYANNSMLTFGTYLVYEIDVSIPTDIVKKKHQEYHRMVVIPDVAEFDRLVVQGYDFGTRKLRPKLRKGAIAFCVFEDKNLVSETWMALDAEAKSAIDPVPFSVDFKAGQACIGVRFTDPKYRKNRLVEYCVAARLQSLIAGYCNKARMSVNANNKISQKFINRFHTELVAKGNYVKLLGWHYWKEEPVKKAMEDN
jgi:hypothetical protein